MLDRLTAPGQVIAVGDEVAAVHERLLDLLDDEPAGASLALVTHDPRLTEAAWRATLRTELLLFLRWLTLRRLSDARGVRPTPLLADDRPVLVLLPRYGYALHALRRLLPLSAAGVQAHFSLPCEEASAARVVMHLANSLGLARLTSPAEAPPGEAFAAAAGDSRATFLTGSPGTLAALRDAWPGSRVVAATGGCSVIVSRDSKTAQQVATALHRRRLSTSCTNLAAVLVGEDPDLTERVTHLHPSVVLRAGPDAGPPSLAGYRVLRCADDASSETPVGFGRDPVGGWPGDYCV